MISKKEKEIFQFTVAGHNGVADGLVVAKHVEEELRLVLGHVPVPLRLIEDEIVVVLVNNHVDVTPVPAQLHRRTQLAQILKVTEDVIYGDNTVTQVITFELIVRRRVTLVQFARTL